jgi:uncharacterized protein YfaA (DUF2138 family)
MSGKGPSAVRFYQQAVEANVQMSPAVILSRNFSIDLVEPDLLSSNSALSSKDVFCWA